MAMQIAAGSLDKVIEIYKPKDTVNKFGEKETTYDFYRKTKAKEDFQSGSRDVENDEIVNGMRITIDVRYYIDIQPRDIIHYEGDRYRVIYVRKDSEENYKEVLIEMINE